jgi:hypothetical protein
VAGALEIGDSPIAQPAPGWIAARFGRKLYFMLSVTGFVLARQPHSESGEWEIVEFFHQVADG